MNIIEADNSLAIDVGQQTLCKLKLLVMRSHFEEYTHKGMEFLKQVAEQLHTPDDTPYADRLTTAVFAALRDLITPEESLHLISSLPMYMKAHYVNGWKILRDKPRLRTREEFFDLVREKYPRTSGRPLGDQQSIERDIVAVITVMKRYVNQGEQRHLQVQLPQPIADLWEMEVAEKNEVDT